MPVPILCLVIGVALLAATGQPSQSAAQQPSQSHAQQAPAQQPTLPLRAQPQPEPDHATIVSFAKARDPGVVALLRHTQAPGVGDPHGFVIDNCATQRVLSDEGRRQARALGDVLRRAGVREAQVLSSTWCRCLETARLLALGPVGVAEFLGSFFAGRGARDEATSGLRRAILAKTAILTPTIMVTHQLNITAVTGLVPAEGEMIFVRGTASGGIEVVGRATLGRDAHGN